jgi:hypothetical protein
VFASWVCWFHELLGDWYFRTIWHDELRPNYTRDIRAIFDVGCQIFESSLPESERRAAFYQAVGDVMRCPLIGRWLDDLESRTVWEDRRESPTPKPLDGTGDAA